MIADFEESDHTYSIDGRDLPSVTRLMEAFGLLDYDRRWFSNDDRQRGEAVHHAVKLICQNRYVESATHPVVAGYAAGFLAFKAKYNYQMIGGEVPLGSLKLGYAGRPDNWGYITDQADYPGVSLLDVKSGTAPPMVGVQLAAYKPLIEETYPGIAIRDLLSVELSKDGSFKVRQQAGAKWLNLWQCCLNLYRIRKEYGLWKEPR